MTHKLRIESKRFVVLAYVCDNKVVGGAPMIKRFFGKPLQTMLNWMGSNWGKIHVQFLDDVQGDQGSS